ncbi:MAG: LysR substrate-binding domain-containing protein [Rhizobiaceae bacterium]
MARRLPSLNALRAFEAAGRHGRMSLAADELNVTHSAISRQVQLLEEALGVSLFEGPRNALRLTEAGRELLPGLTTGFDQIDVAVRLVADTDDGPLDVSCLGSFTMRWLIPRLHRFQALHPGIEVRLSSSDAPVDFSRAAFDVAIRVGSEPWPCSSEVIPLIHEHVAVVVAPRLAGAVAADFSLVARLHTKTRPSAWDDWQAQTGIAVGNDVDTTYEHFYFMLEAAVAGLGMCIAPYTLIADDLLGGRLVAPFGFQPSGQTYVALRRPRRHRKSTLFCGWLAEEAAQFEVAPRLA